jgi:cell division protein FtsN
MKMNYLKIFIVFLLALTFGCSNNAEEQKTEIRFVDLQGNPRAIKTRVPEANARIMSGQSSFDSGKNSVEIYKENSAKNLTESKKDYVGKNRNADPFSNNLKNNQPIIPIENTGSASEFKDYESSEKNPVVEYDFSKEYEKSNNNNLNNKASEAITKNNEDNFQEDRLELGSAPKNAKSSNKKLSNKGSKIITYSNKKNQKNNKLDNSAQSEQEEEVEAESVKEINQDKSGKFYVQIGSFFNSRGAKERLAKNNEFGKGKVLIAYKNNKRIYRSVFGPFKSRKSALKLRDSIIESGNEAVIIKGK